MEIIKRSGRREPVRFDKITRRIEKLCHGLSAVHVKGVELAQKVIGGLYDGVTTSEIDKLAAEDAAAMVTVHPDYDKLAARIFVSRMHKETEKSLLACFRLLTKNGLLSPDVLEVAKKYVNELEAVIDHGIDDRYTYFGIRTLYHSYLLQHNGVVIERPQHMYMRVAIGLWGDDIEGVLKTYALLSQGMYTHATPTLYNGGTTHPQLASCFLLHMQDDSIEGIYNTLKQCALISKDAGGIGFHVNNIRAAGSSIRGGAGVSDGIVPMLRNFDTTARYVNQLGKRKGSFAVYLEPWHADIYEFLDLKKNHGKEELRARDLFYAMWIPDLFMQRVEEGGKWSLFSPDVAVGLGDSYGDTFSALYKEYESEQKYMRQVEARDLFHAIITAQIETGLPYMLYKDSVNRKTNQSNLGTIKSSNLCAEILEYTDKDEVAVCNLASVALPKYVVGKKYDFKALYDVVYHMTLSLNKVIDVTSYPIEEAKHSNLRHRPIGIGVQGLADTFFKLRYSYGDDASRALNKKIFETIYFAALTASKDIAIKEGAYDSYEGSPVSKGILQFDMWGVKPDDKTWDWKGLRKEIKKHGVRNSLLVAPMPTASTAQVLGNTECFEPITSNLYVRRVLSGEFVVINRYLVDELLAIGLWDEEMKISMMREKGSVAAIERIPADIRDRYKTVWEISQKVIIDMAADRAPYICQTQSMNLFMEKPTVSKVASMHMYSWKAGLKTGMYYLRTRPAVDAIQFTVPNKKVEAADSCSTEEGECVSCGS